MTSKISFTDILTEDLKRRIWPLALSITGFFFALPVLAMIKIEDHLNSLRMGYDTLISLQSSFTSYTLGKDNYFAIAGLFFMAVLNALNGMRYLHSRQETDFYGSVPVLRRTKFLAAYINGILITIVPFVIMHLITSLLGILNGLVTGAGVICGVLTILLMTAGYILIYTVIILSAILTGHGAVTVAGAAFLSFAPLWYYVMMTGYASVFFVTMYDSNEAVMNYLSPFTFFFDIIKAKGIRYTGHNLIAGLIALLISAALLILCVFLIRKRPAEAASKAMAFDKSRPVFKVLILIPAALSFGLFFESASNRYAYAWLAFGIIAGVILGHAVIEIIYEFDLRAAAAHIPSGLLAAAITVFIALFFVFDLMGFDTKLPEEDQIVSASVFLPGINSGTYYYDEYSEDEDSYYSRPEGAKELESMFLKDTADAYMLARAGSEWAAANRWHLPDDQEGDGYEEEDPSEYTNICIFLRKSSGGVFKRSYYVDLKDSANFSALSRIYDAGEYKEKTYEIYSCLPEAYAGRTELLTFDTGVYSDTTTDITSDRLAALVEALKKDTSKLKLDYLADEVPIGEVTINVDEPDSMYAGSTYTVHLGFVYPSFNDTLTQLESLGLCVNREIRAADIDFIIKTTWDDDFMNSQSEDIRDPLDIAKLYPNLVSQNYCSVNYAVMQTDNSVDYEVHFNRRLFTGLKDIDDYDNRFVQFFYEKKPSGTAV